LTQKGVLIQFDYEPEYAIIYSKEPDVNMRLYTKLTSSVKSWLDAHGKLKKDKKKGTSLSKDSKKGKNPVKESKREE
jgi:hypothetical protein